MVSAVDVATGHLVWRHDTGGGSVHDLAVSGDVLYIGAGDGVVSAVDVATGHLGWTHDTGGGSVHDLAVSEDMLFFTVGDGYLYALVAGHGGQPPITTRCVSKVVIRSIATTLSIPRDGNESATHHIEVQKIDSTGPDSITLVVEIKGPDGLTVYDSDLAGENQTLDVSGDRVVLSSEFNWDTGEQAKEGQYRLLAYVHAPSKRDDLCHATWSGAWGTGAGDVTFELHASAFDDHGGSTSDATQISLGATIDGDIEAYGDLDYFSFRAERGVEYTVATRLITVSDTMINLFDSEGRHIDGNDDGGYGAGSSFEWTAPASGIYYIEVRGRNNQTGTYRLSVRITALPAQSIMPVCDRTLQVRDAIVVVLDASSCQEVTETQLSAITGLDLSDKEITSLQLGDFSGLSSLQSLSLSSNLFSSLPVDIFYGLSTLQSLSLSGNPLWSLPEDVFSELSSLQFLYLRENRLSSLPEDVFSGLSSLQSLYLHENRLSSLPEGVFSGLSNLQSLYLHDNQLSSLPEDVFSGMSSLQSLVLFRNWLSSLPEEVFSGMSSLRSLDLSRNQLSSLPEEVFSGLSSLQWLELGSNQLSSLPEEVFSGLSSLESLGLWSNQFSSLPEEVFSELSSLQSLSLSGNGLSSLPEDVFSGLFKLQDLSLYDNQLGNLSPSYFQGKGLNSLETLRLGYSDDAQETDQQLVAYKAVLPNLTLLELPPGMSTS